MASLIERKGKGRNKGRTFYYVQYYVAGKAIRKSLNTTSLQIAKEKLRRFESARFQGDDCPLPTKTPIAEIVSAYVEHIQATKTRNGVKSDLWYLRELFGPMCPALALPNDGKKRSHIEATFLESITTAQVSEFISAMVRTRGHSPKTANRFREVAQRVFNWAMSQRGIRTPAKPPRLSTASCQSCSSCQKRLQELRPANGPKIPTSLNIQSQCPNRLHLRVMPPYTHL